MTSKQLRQTRKHLGVSQSELARALGMHKNSVARMEQGRMKILPVTELAVKYLLIMESKKRRGKK